MLNLPDLVIKMLLPQAFLVLGTALRRAGGGNPARRRNLVRAREAFARRGNHGQSHIAIQEHLDGKAADWMEQVRDEQYKA